jgi:hypothetical protein
MHMKPPFKGIMCIVGCVMLASLTSFQFGAAPSKRADACDGAEFPPGWKPASPRDEIRPGFSFDSKGGPKGDGSLIIAADEREGLHGWWQKTFPIVGGRHYHFQALRKVKNVTVPRRSAVVRIVWQDDKGKPVPMSEPAVGGYLKGWAGTAESEHPTDKKSDAQGWTEVSDAYRAPDKATQAVVELHLLWAPRGTIEWSNVS